MLTSKSPVSDASYDQRIQRELERLLPVSDPLRDSVIADPYRFYRWLQEHDPAHEVFPGLCLIVTYADVMSLLRDPTRFGSDLRNSARYKRLSDVFAISAQSVDLSGMGSMVLVDPPDHTRLRKLVNKAFTARAVECLRERTNVLVSHMLDRLAECGDRAIDLVEELAYPIPVAVICELLGVPPSDRHYFHEWTADLVTTEDPVFWMDGLQSSNSAGRQLHDYFADLASQRRREPADDLLSSLIAAEAGSHRLTAEELYSTCILLLVAGHETTVSLISSGALRLLQNPVQAELFRTQPRLLKPAIEELLRYEAPVPLVGRVLMEEVQLHGRKLEAGSELVLALAAANRDPAQWPNPDALDIRRDVTGQIAFGNHIHRCLGAPLARMEGEIALSALIRRFPLMELAVEQPEWRATLTLRRLVRLPVILGKQRSIP